MKKIATSMFLCAALGASMLTSRAFAKSADSSATFNEGTSSVHFLPDARDALAPTTGESAASDNAIAGMKDKAKHAWNSVKKGTSNLLGKRVKGHTKTANLHSAKGAANLHNFLHGGPKTTHRPMGPPRSAGRAP